MISATYFEQIESAMTPTDLFPEADSARATYRRLARIVHPDVNAGDTRAAEAFAHLTELWEQYNGRAPHMKRHPADSHGRLIYETKRNAYAVFEMLAKGDISNVYAASYIKDADSFTSYGVLKMPRDPANNDLVVSEIQTLKTLKETVPERFQIFYPTTVDTFVHRDKDNGKTRRSIILEYLNDYVSLADILDAYPKGIDPRDMAWMARRLWIAMDVAHDAGLVHGAVFPEHVMVHPTSHNLALVDWSYSVPRDEKLKVLVPKYEKLGWYGTSKDKPLDHRLDVRQAAHTLESLLGEYGARPFRAFFNGCRVASTPTAGELFEEFDELLKRLYGKRKYRPFEMPKGWKRAV